MSENSLNLGVVAPLILDLSELVPTVITDYADYAPGATVTISGSGYTPNTTVQIDIADAPDDYGDDGEQDFYQPILVTVDQFGNFTTTWVVPSDNNGTGSGTPDALNGTLILTATGEDGQVATIMFTDSREDYKHWANLPPLNTTNWQNGALQQSNSQYYEGGVVPHYFTTTLSEGLTYSFWIAYDYYINGDDDGGFKWLNTYNLTETPVLPVGNAGMPLADSDTTFESGGNIFIKNADVLSIGSFVTQTNGNNVIRYVPVTFIVTNGDGDSTDKNIQADFYWGLQLALHGDVTSTSNGASEWSGASIRTSVNDKNPTTGAFIPGTTGIGGGGDLSINPNAVLPLSISGYKWGDSNGNGIWDKPSEVGLSGWTIQLYKDDGDGSFETNGEDTLTTTLSNLLGFYEFSDLLTGKYFVQELLQDGWQQTYPITPTYYTIDLAAGSPSVTDKNFGNRQSNPSLTIVKSLTNADDAIVDTANEVIEYTIVVDNTGNVDLTGVTLTDIFAGGATLISGDTNNNSILETTETWTYSADYVVTQADLNAGGTLTNVAKVVTNQTTERQDDATSTVEQNPSINIEKYVSVDSGTTWFEADSPTGPLLTNVAGINPEFKIEVTNDGNVTLSNIEVSDYFGYDHSIPISLDGLKGLLFNPDDPDNPKIVGDSISGDNNFTLTGNFAVGETLTLYYEGTWKEGQHANTAYVDAYDPSQTPIKGEDAAHYYGSFPGVVTNTEFSTFNNGGELGHFNLIFANGDQGNEVIATNPGQFYYNLMYVSSLDPNSADSPETDIILEIPFPFVIQGAQPVHVYDDFPEIITNPDGTIHLDEANFGTPLTTYSAEYLEANKRLIDKNDNGIGDFGDVYQYFLDNVPTSADGTFDGTAYINIHLEYGLKGEGGYSPYNQPDGSIDALSDINPDILDGTAHTFAAYEDKNGDQIGSHSTDESDELIGSSEDIIYNNNIFKKNWGVGGLILDQNGQPIEDEYFRVELYQGKSNDTKPDMLIGSNTTDANQWYSISYKHTGKPVDYYVIVYSPNDDEIVSDPFTLGGSNKYEQINFQYDPSTDQFLNLAPDPIV